jgi:hypothetical protein
MKRERVVECNWARIDVKGGREALKNALERGAKVTAQVTILLDDTYSMDGESIEFSGAVMDIHVVEET